MGAAVTKYHTDEQGYFKIDEVCPAMNVNNAGVQCKAPAQSSDEETKKMADRKYFLVADHMANPALGSMVPFPVNEQGFFLDTQDHITKQNADPEALKKTLYYLTTQRDPRTADEASVTKLQVPGTWCAHVKPCPAGVPCCPEVAPAVPVLSTNAAVAAASGITGKITKSKPMVIKFLMFVAFLIAVYFAYMHFVKNPNGAPQRFAQTPRSPAISPRTNYRPAGFET